MHMSFSIFFDCLQIFTNSILLASYVSLIYLSIVSYRKSASLPKTFKISYAVSVNSVFVDIGTFGIAVLRLGRKFVGIEIDPERFKLAEINIASVR
jgi:hypothetical protein